jgi:hypothetical protein
VIGISFFWECWSGEGSEVDGRGTERGGLLLLMMMMRVIDCITTYLCKHACMRINRVSMMGLSPEEMESRNHELTAKQKNEH